MQPSSSRLWTGTLIRGRTAQTPAFEPLPPPQRKMHKLVAEAFAANGAARGTSASGWRIDMASTLFNTTNNDARLSILKQ